MSDDRQDPQEPPIYVPFEFAGPADITYDDDNDAEQESTEQGDEDDA